MSEADNGGKKILLTGGAGGLGRIFAPRFVEAGHTVRVFDLPTPANKKRFTGKEPGIELFWGDITDAACVREAARGMDEVFHLAALVFPATEPVPEIARRVNVDGTQNVINAVAEESEKRGTPVPIRFSSSVTVHGITSHLEPPIRVDHPLTPTNVYTETKIKGEELIRNSGLDWTIYRFAATVYLEIRTGDFGTMKKIPADCRAEFAHLYDVCTALLNTIGNPEAVGGIFPLGGGKRCQMLYRDQLKMIFDLFGFPEPNWKKFTHEPFALDWYDTTEAQRVLNFQNHTMEQYIEDFKRAMGMKYYAIHYAAAPLLRLFRVHL
ncbi:MAG TPA: NAD(P)-dependent oxidoreductase [bacterium]|nr:NAD(P)-dependent oxidoreductase [bacterium]